MLHYVTDSFQASRVPFAPEEKMQREPGFTLVKRPLPPRTIARSPWLLLLLIIIILSNTNSNTNVIVVTITVIISIIIRLLLTNGVNTHGVAAEVTSFDGLGKKVHPVSITRFPLRRFSPGAGLLRNPFVHRWQDFPGAGSKKTGIL